LLALSLSVVRSSKLTWPDSLDVTQEERRD
jgi:hypothetical protein